MPAAMPLATKPAAAVTLMWWFSRGSGVERDEREAGGLVEAAHEVRTLDGLPRRPLDEVVDGGEDDEPTGARIDPGGDLRGVRPEGGLGGGRRVGDDDEGFVVVAFVEDGERVVGGELAGGPG